MRRSTRRRLLGAGSALGAAAALGLDAVQAATRTRPATPRTLAFPRDAGAHTDAQTEWWYLTGWISAGSAGPVPEASYGFQITFFRSRVDAAQGMQSRLAARQLLFAHAAITDVAAKRLWHDQRIERWSGEAPGHNAMDMASASTLDTGVLLQDWSLLRDGLAPQNGALAAAVPALHARVAAQDFQLDLHFAATQALLLQGQQGWSRKGPQPQQGSYYYSLPQLRVSGSLTLRGKSLQVAAGSTAWLDHEWSQEMLPAGAVGWDWLGINLFDGSALTAFQLRDQAGGVLWDGGSFRAGEVTGKGSAAGSNLYTFSRGEVIFKPLRLWRSAVSRSSYPVEWLVRTPADFYTVKAVVDNQELDSRNSTGAIYWEGLCEVWDSNQRKVGRGYLEMTGYAAPLRM